MAEARRRLHHGPLTPAAAPPSPALTHLRGGRLVEALRLEGAVRSAVNTDFGIRHEDDAISLYERQTGRTARRFKLPSSTGTVQEEAEVCCPKMHKELRSSVYRSVPSLSRP